jgi:hypothetical protein
VEVGEAQPKAHPGKSAKHDLKNKLKSKAWDCGSSGGEEYV